MKFTLLFADKPLSAALILLCFVVLLVLPWLHLAPVDSAFICLRTGSH